MPQMLSITYPYEIERKIIDRYINSQFPDGGWSTNYPTDKETCVWTTADVFISLSIPSVKIKYYEECIDYILKTDRFEECWTEGELFHKENISIIETSIAVRALLYGRKFEEITVPLLKIQSLQNRDGGWGIMRGHKESYVRISFYPLMALLDGYRNERTRLNINTDVIQLGIDWIFTMQNDDFSFRKFNGDKSADISCTAMSLIVLITAYSLGFSVNKNKIKKGLKRLKELEKNGTWAPTQETIVGSLEDYGKFTVPIRSSGTPMVFIAFCLASFYDLIKFDDAPFDKILLELEKQCYDGYYHLPYGPEDIRVWEGSYWLLGLKIFKDILLREIETNFIISSKKGKNIKNEFEKKYTDLQEKYDIVKNEVRDLQAKNKKLLTSNRFLIFLLFFIVIMSLINFRVFDNIIQGFSKLPVLVQIITGIILTIILEEIYTRLIRDRIVNYFKKRKNNYLKKSNKYVKYK